MSEQDNHVKITNVMMYQKLVEISDGQIKIWEKIDGLADLPDRVRAVEIEQAKIAWISKVAYSALTAGIVSVIAWVTTLGKQLKLFTSAFWVYAGERAIKTAAQAAVAVLGSNTVTITNIDFVGLLAVAGGAALLSVLTSIVASK